MIHRVIKKLKIEEPKFLPFDQWKIWREHQKKTRPIAYFIKYNIFEKVNSLYEDILNAIWYNPVYAIKYRTTHKYHILDTGKKPGYQDFDNRILHGLFNELVNFVECEKAWLNRLSDKSIKRGLFEKFRSREKGIEYLEWEINLGEDEKEQSENAREVLELYKWWTEVYLKRPDPSDASGWSSYCDMLESKFGDIFISSNKISDEMKEKEKKCLDRLHEIEEAYCKEEEEMLIRLIKIRKSLWT